MLVLNFVSSNDDCADFHFYEASISEQRFKHFNFGVVVVPVAVLR